MNGKKEYSNLIRVTQAAFTKLLGKNPPKIKHHDLLDCEIIYLVFFLIKMQAGTNLEWRNKGLMYSLSTLLGTPIHLLIQYNAMHFIMHKHHNRE